MKRLAKGISYLVLLVASIVFMLAVYIGIWKIIEKWAAPSDWLFCQMDVHVEYLSILLLMIPAILILQLIFRKILPNIHAQDDLLWFWNRFKSVRVIIVLVWLLGIYACFSSITFVTGNRIIRHTPLHPLGQKYFYEDVTQVKAEFGQHVLSLWEYNKKGNFSYTVTVDGKRIIFSTPSVNEAIARYEEDTYLELEEFDQALMQLGVPKESSDIGWENCGLDAEYTERFLRIVYNEPAK